MGEEYRLRFFFERLQWELFEEEEFFTVINSSTINQEFISSLSKYFPQSNTISYFRILHIFRLSIIRFKSGNIIDRLPDNFFILNNPLISFTDFSKNIAVPFLKKYGLHTNKSYQLELRYLYCIISLLIDYNYDALNANNANNIITSEKEMIITRTFIASLEELIGKNLTKKDKIYFQYNFISSYLRFHIFRTTTIINPINFEVEKPRVESIAYSIAQKILTDLSTNFPDSSNIFLDELFMLRTTSIIRNILPKYTPTINIAILSKSGNLYVDTLKNQLNQLNFGKVNFLDINDPNIDLIVCDYHISNLFLNSLSSIRILIYTFPLNMKDIQEIFQIIEKLNQEKYNI